MVGVWKRAAVPVASVVPAVVAPAKVVTTPAGVTLRIALFASSATYSFPAASNAMLLGAPNFAAVPVASTKPLVLPANVDTVLFGPTTAFVGAPGTMPGFTVTPVDAGPVPAALVAVTVTVYVVPFVRPEIVHVVAGAVAVQNAPPGLAVAL
jgi:hypothetical protein